MTIPCYQFVKIQGHDPRIIEGQLQGLPFGKVPVVLEIDHLEENQRDAILAIEDFFENHRFPNLPYSYYIVSTYADYKGKLFIAKDKSSLPRFFNRKNKSLNAKEINFLNKIELKQKNFDNLLEHEYISSINYYATEHKKISQKQNFLVYLEKINKGLKDYYGKKD